MFDTAKRQLAKVFLAVLTPIAKSSERTSRLILEALHSDRQKVWRIDDLVRATDLSRPTLYVHLTLLEDDGLAVAYEDDSVPRSDDIPRYKYEITGRGADLLEKQQRNPQITSALDVRPS